MTNSLDFSKQAIDLLEDNKADNLVLLDVHEKLGITDYFVVATAQSNPHLSFLKTELKKHLDTGENREHVHTEGEADQEWLLVDYGDVIIQLFTDKKRELYDLEGLWADSEVEDQSTHVNQGDNDANS